MTVLRYYNGSTYVDLPGVQGPPGPTGPPGNPVVAHQRWYRAAALSTATGAWTTIPFDTQQENQDPGGAITWDANNNWFRINQAGIYMATANVGGAFSLNGTGRRALMILKNGVQVATGYAPAASVLIIGLSCSTAVQCAVGDTLQTQFYQDSGSAVITTPSGNNSALMSVSLMSGPQGPQGPQGPAGPPGTIVSVRAWRQAAYTLPVGSGTAFVYDTKQWDTQNAYNNSTGVFTAPVAGKYRVLAQVAFNSTAANQVCYAVLLKNGAAVANSYSSASTATNQWLYAQAVDTLDLAVGDTISIQSSAPTGAIAVYASQTNTYMTIDLLSGTGPAGPAGPVGPPGTSTNLYSIFYYQTIPALRVVTNPYTLTHNLGTRNVLVEVYDSVTGQLVTVGVQVYDQNTILLTTAQDMPNPVNVVVAGIASSAYPVNPGDLATKAYVDAKTATLPAPVTSGSGIQSFTDALGDVWVAANGVNSGNWKRARDVLLCRYTRAAAFTAATGTGSNLLIYDTLQNDTYGLYNATTGVFTAPIAGIWDVSHQVTATATASGQVFRADIVHGVVPGGAMNANAPAQASVGGSVTSAVRVLPRITAVGDQWSFGAAVPTGGVALNVLTNYWQTFMMILYAGTG